MSGSFRVMVAATIFHASLAWRGPLTSSGPGVPHDTQEALRIGYVSQVVPPEQLMDTVMSYAKQLAKGPQVVMELAKWLI